MSNNDFERALDFVFGNEGGYSNDSADRGGATNLGITAGTLMTAYNRGIVSHCDVKSLTRAEAAEIYRVMYWEPSKADCMPTPLCIIHFDSAVNHGVGGAGRLLQRAINNGSGVTVDEDGMVGDRTLAALNEWLSRDGVAIVATNYCDRREDYYRRIVAYNPSQEKFLKGWLARNQKCRDLIKKGV